MPRVDGNRKLGAAVACASAKDGARSAEACRGALLLESAESGGIAVGKEQWASPRNPSPFLASGGLARRGWEKESGVRSVCVCVSVLVWLET